MKWADLDLETGRAVLDTKTGQRVLPLTGPALKVLSDLPRIEGNPWVFVGAVKGSRIQYKTVRGVFRAACEATGIEGVRLHDLRRGFLTEAAKRFPAFVVAALAHL